MTEAIRQNIQELTTAINNELKKVRETISSWGLDDVGMERILMMMRLFEEKTVAEVVFSKQYDHDVRESLSARLENVRGVRLASNSVLKEARQATWAAEYMIEAERDPKSGLMSIIRSPDQRYAS